MNLSEQILVESGNGKISSLVEDIKGASQVFVTSRKTTRGDSSRTRNGPHSPPSGPFFPMFEKKFDEVTHGQLDGLDWSNAFVAGGMVLVLF